jgi:hypothetical protein
MWREENALTVNLKKEPEIVLYLFCIDNRRRITGEKYDA